jgi:hypothetical protein
VDWSFIVDPLAGWACALSAQAPKATQLSARNHRVNMARDYARARLSQAAPARARERYFVIGAYQLTSSSYDERETPRNGSPDPFTLVARIDRGEIRACSTLKVTSCRAAMNCTA